MFDSSGPKTEATALKPTEVRKNENYKGVLLKAVDEKLREGTLTTNEIIEVNKIRDKIVSVASYDPKAEQKLQGFSGDLSGYNINVASSQFGSPAQSTSNTQNMNSAAQPTPQQIAQQTQQQQQLQNKAAADAAALNPSISIQAGTPPANGGNIQNASSSNEEKEPKQQMMRKPWDIPNQGTGETPFERWLSSFLKAMGSLVERALNGVIQTAVGLVGMVTKPIIGAAQVGIGKLASGIGLQKIGNSLQERGNYNMTEGIKKSASMAANSLLDAAIGERVPEAQDPNKAVNPKQVVPLAPAQPQLKNPQAPTNGQTANPTLPNVTPNTAQGTAVAPVVQSTSSTANPVATSVVPLQPNPVGQTLSAKVPLPPTDPTAPTPAAIAMGRNFGKAQNAIVAQQTPGSQVAQPANANPSPDPILTQAKAYIDADVAQGSLQEQLSRKIEEREERARLAASGGTPGTTPDAPNTDDNNNSAGSGMGSSAGG